MHVYNEIPQFNLICSFKFQHYLTYPKITKDIMVFAGFRELDGTVQTHLRRSRAQNCTMKKT